MCEIFRLPCHLFHPNFEPVLPRHLVVDGDGEGDLHHAAPLGEPVGQLRGDDIHLHGPPGGLIKGAAALPLLKFHPGDDQPGALQHHRTAPDGEAGRGALHAGDLALLIGQDHLPVFPDGHDALRGQLRHLGGNAVVGLLPPDK